MTELLVELRPGEVLGPYRVESLAAAGGSSLVYRATHMESGDPVALKVARGNDGAMLRRMRREALLLTQADHGNIVGFRQAGLHNGRPFIVTDWIQGRSLADFVAEHGPVGFERALHLAAEVADALDHLHRRSIVHRDLSLSNVLIDDEGKPWLIDLGVGRSDLSTTVTMDGAIAGTPRYVAPEVIRDDDVDGRADQYSLAVVVHELIAGASPFPETDNAATALYQQLDALPEPLSEVDPTVPRSVEQAVLRALEKDPDDRFDQVGDFVRAAWDPADGSGVTVRRPGRVLLTVGAALAVLAVVVAVVWSQGDDVTEDDAIDGGDVAAPAEESGSTTSEAPAGDAAVSSPVSSLPGPTETTNDPAGGVDGSGSATSTSAAGPAPGGEQPVSGQAAAMPCNLLTVADFDGGVTAVDFFAPADNERVVPGTGVDGSPALEVGRSGLFGQYAETVEALPGEAYGFSVWFSAEGDVGDTKIGVTFLDAAYEALETVDLPLQLGPLHQAVLLTGPAPDATRYALPWVFKDASTGLVYADEMVFAKRSDCAESIFAGGARS